MTKKTIRTLHNLAQQSLIKSEDINDLEEVVKNFSLAITPTMYDCIDKTNPTDPIAQQFVPTLEELNIVNEEMVDPIGDTAHQAVKGIVHRYPDRCLFMPVQVCPVYCRFCFRREKVAQSSQTLNPLEIATAFNYIETHKEIWEVILSGGDPLILKSNMLKEIISKLNAIPHVEIIRFHTRIPVVDPARINAEMLSAFQSEKPIYILIHANHAQEFTPAAIKACADLVNSGIPLLSQTTLLKGINDDIESLSQLMRTFLKNKIKPYYLHHADLAKGTAHFRTTIAEGQNLIKQLRGRFSGLCQPAYVLDIPGGYGKVPIGPSYIQENKNKYYMIEDYCGNFHTYSTT